MGEIVEQIKPVEQKPVEIKKDAVIETTSIIDRADAVAKKLQEQNDRTELLLQRQEAIAARMMLSGRAEAGQVQKTPQQAAEEQMNEEVNRRLNMFKPKR